MKFKSSRPQFKGENVHIAIVLTRFNDEIGNKLYKNTVEALLSHHVDQKYIHTFRVPGALETPFAAQLLAEKHLYDAIIVLGAVIRGDTYHFELVCNESYRGLMDVSLKYNVPIIFGILTVNNLQQAMERVEKNGLNKGQEFAEAALEMAQLAKNDNL